MEGLQQFRHISTSLSDDGVLLLKYNRPEAANAINSPMMKELLEAFQWATTDPRVKVIVQTGEGRFFTTGMDLSSESTRNQEEQNHGPQTLYRVNRLLIDCPKITIAAANGPGVGYGTSSIALFDLVYAVPDAYFFTPFIKWGLCAEACSSFTFASAMGRAKASHLVLTGERASAQELESAGLISKIIPRDNFLDDVLSIAHRIARLPSESLKVNKQLLSHFSRAQLHEANELELRYFQELLRTDDAKKAAQTFAREQALKKSKARATAEHL